MPLYTIAPSSRRNMHYHPFSPVVFGHGYGPRHSACAPRSASLVPSLFKDLESDFSSLDSFFNDILSPQQQSLPIRSFQPRFDVREEADAFHLTGDIPGVEAGNIAVEFTDRDTMIVKGRTIRETSRGNASAATASGALHNEKAVEEGSTEAQAPAAPTEEDAMETEAAATTTTSRPATPDSTGSNYHKATVEDSRDETDDFVDVAAESNDAAPAEKTSENDNTATTAQQQEVQQKPSKPSAEEDQGRYWVSERNVGEFSRTFRFPAGQADRDNVMASLKDGVLKVVVPKVKEQGARRITVE